MNRPEHELARTLVQYLDDGVDRLAPAVRNRLQHARNEALSHYGEKQPVLGLAAGGSIAGIDGRLVAGAALLLALTGVIWWQSNGSPVSELAEIDSNLLSDELPVNAYLDKGFDSWLKRSSR